MRSDGIVTAIMRQLTNPVRGLIAMATGTQQNYIPKINY